MLETIRHGDVTELRFSSWRSRRSGYAVSAFVTQGAVIDSGFPDVADEFGQWLDANPLDGAIITHAHEDHSAGVPALLDRGLGVQCAAATEEWMRAEEHVALFRRICWGKRQRLVQPLKAYQHPTLTLRHTPASRCCCNVRRT